MASPLSSVPQTTPDNTPQRRVGETDALFPHVEVPFTAADREALYETRDMLRQIFMALENFGIKN